MPKNNINAFTKKHKGLAIDIITKCSISIPIDLSKFRNPPNIPSFPVKALWDTGATGCVITKEVVRKMGLRPIGKAKVHHGGGKTDENVYLISIYLPNKVAISTIKVTECNETAGRFGFIIGMDVISKGDFSITNVNGKTTFSFRMPSIEEIDYTS